MKRLFLTFLILYSLSTAQAASTYLNKPEVGQYIDWSNPLTRDLYAVWLMNEGKGNIPIDSTNTQRFISKKGLLTKGTEKGLCYYNDSTTADANIRFQNNGMLSTNYHWTIIWLHYPFQAQISGGGRRVMCVPIAGAETAGIPDLLYNGTNNMTWISTNGMNIVSSNNFVKMKEWHTYAVTWSGSIFYRGLHMYRDAVEATYQTQVDGSSFSAPANYYLIGNRAQLDRALDGYLAFIYVFRRVLTQDELRKITNQPFIFIKPSFHLYYNYSAPSVSFNNQIFFIE